MGPGPQARRPPRPARHQTLRRAIDWSHDLLTDAERVLFRRLSVLADGFTVRAVEAMLEPTQPPSIELLSSLLLKNLVRVEPETTLGAEPKTRFRLLETLRETEVANLIAHGLTNRQIAEDLVIAQRTVDTHVERILGNLGFASRAQVAAWVVRQGGRDHSAPEARVL